MLSFVAMDFFRRSPLLSYPLIALALFMLVFLVVTVKTVLTRKSQYDHMAHLPLEGAQTANVYEEARRG